MLLSKNPNILLFQEITPMKPKSDPKGAPCLTNYSPDLSKEDKVVTNYSPPLSSPVNLPNLVIRQLVVLLLTSTNI